MSHKLDNYLRTHRKRAGLTQDETAFLLGCRSGAKVSRYERFRRQPSLQTIFAYEVIFGIPARELFAGISEEIERETLRRVRKLLKKLRKATPGRKTMRKLEMLRLLLEEEGIISKES
jgi:transcriptional regulator with XRE-family HTH domain